ncbi:MAG: dihydroorotate dehydrogenase electron transfer subunit [Lachnospiraceae bacterium]
MIEKAKELVTVVSQEPLATGIYSLWLQSEHLADTAKAGQFLSVYTKDSSKLLPRPISICEVNVPHKQVRIVYRVTGTDTGTEQFAALKAGDTIEVLGPLGNGFPIESSIEACLIGGGIGIPPMLELAKTLSCKKDIVVGYKDELFLQEELAQQGTVYIATEDGSAGIKGNVVDVLKERTLSPDIIYACGPTPMLKAVKDYAKAHNILCYISMEERMACGIGACLACVCQSKEKDAHSQVHNKRVCKDGPVFLSTEVEL